LIGVIEVIRSPQRPVNVVGLDILSTRPQKSFRSDFLLPMGNLHLDYVQGELGLGLYS